MPLKFDILTIFPNLFDSPFSESILKRAQEKGLVSLKVHDIRTHTHDRHRTVDDVPYGGGPGMVMKPEPIVEAIEAVTGQFRVSGGGSPSAANGETMARQMGGSGGERVSPPAKKTRRIYFSPQGRTLKQDHLKDYLLYDQLVLLCGRYEGMDERVVEHFIDEEVSIGDYVLTGGEFSAMVFVDAVTRLIPGVLGAEESLKDESFSSGPLLEYPHYTRPPEFRGHKVPEILLSGDHKKIEEWRREQALLRTQKKRPDLLK